MEVIFPFTINLDDIPSPFLTAKYVLPEIMILHSQLFSAILYHTIMKGLKLKL